MEVLGNVKIINKRFGQFATWSTSAAVAERPWVRRMVPGPAAQIRAALKEGHAPAVRQRIRSTLLGNHYRKNGTADAVQTVVTHLTQPLNNDSSVNQKGIMYLSYNGPDH